MRQFDLLADGRWLFRPLIGSLGYCVQLRLHVFARIALGVAVILGGLIGGIADPATAGPVYADIVVDYKTGEILRSRNADQKTYPASLAKMMTLMLAFEALDKKQLSLNQKLKASARAASMPATNLSLRRGSTITVEQAILALVIRSANDAAVVLAEAIGGSEARFAQLMTAKARRLGMNNTVFRNASGLPNEGQVTTARDMARLGIALIRDYPHYYHYFSRTSFRYAGRSYSSHNRILGWYKGADGLKTGFIRKSGFNLVTSATRNGRRLVGVVLGGPTASARDGQMGAILDQSFASFASRQGGEKKPILTVGAGKTAPSAAPAAGSGGPLLAEAFIPPRKPTPMEALIARIDERPAASPELSKIALEQAPPPVIDTAIDSPAPEEEPIFNPVRKPVAFQDELVSEPTALPPLRPLKVNGNRYWMIQVGAYGDYQSAQKAASLAAKQLRQHVQDGQIAVEERKGTRSVLYRARIAGLAQKDAEAACQVMKRQKKDCLVLKGDPNMASNEP